MKEGEVFVIISQDSKVLEANEAFCQLLDHPKDIIVRKTLLELIHPEDHKIVVNAFIDVFYGIHKPKTYTFRLVSSNGDHISTDAIFTSDRSNTSQTASIELKLAS